MSKSEKWLTRRHSLSVILEARPTTKYEREYLVEIITPREQIRKSTLRPFDQRTPAVVAGDDPVQLYEGA